MSFKNCPYCNQLFDADTSHGNAKFCSHGCYYNFKINKSIQQYKQKQILLSRLNTCDTILHQFNEIYGPDIMIDAILLDKVGFDWSISQGTIYGNGLPYTVINKYAYALFQNATLLIWTIK